MRKVLSFFAMSALVLGMAFTFNACGGNDANNPENPANPTNPELNTKYFSVAVSVKETNANQSLKMHIKVTPKENVENFVCHGFIKTNAEEFGCLTLDGFWAHIKKFNLITLYSHFNSGKPWEEDANFENDAECIVLLFALDENKEPIADSWTTKTFRTPKGPNPNSENGMMPGVFTVDLLGTQVHFSQGNLQYNAASDTWQFAANQWDTLGIANEQIGKADYSGWIDLFGWNTAENPTLVSTSNADYPEPFKDWGKNTIANGGNQTWKTLSSEQWNYLFILRTKAELLYGLGSVAGVNGLILLPDNWTMPAGVPEFAPSSTKGLVWQSSRYYNYKGDNFKHNTYTAEEWDTMEKAGAIFLPAAGKRLAPRFGTTNTAVYGAGGDGYYWSATPSSQTSADFVSIGASEFYPQNTQSRMTGASVRLVR